MAKLNFKKIVVKVGTNVITKENGELDLVILKNLVNQLCELRRRGVQTALVTSGAMGAGRSLVKFTEHLTSVAKRQVLASVGQIPLMKTYLDLFGQQGFLCAQILATREDFRDRRHYENMKTCFESLFKENIIPVVNENDTVSVEELMFTDNDELASLIGTLIHADAVFILSGVNGLYDRNPEDPSARLIPVVDCRTKDFEKFISAKKSTFGRGGMATKARLARKLSLLGIIPFIANGKKPDILLDLFEGNPNGTRFLSCQKQTEAKRRIAHSRGYEKGVVIIRKDAEATLSSRQVCSLLPIGISHVEGEFSKGDIVKIRNQNKEDVGCGRAQYSSDLLRKKMGQKHEKPFILYNYLFLEL